MVTIKHYGTTTPDFIICQQYKDGDIALFRYTKTGAYNPTSMRDKFTIGVWKAKIDLKQIDNVVFDGRGVDRFIMSADYKGREMTDNEIEYMNTNHNEWIYEYELP